MSKVWIFGDDVDTDQIIASQYIILPGIDEMTPHTFESLDAGFASAVQPGDIIVAGKNFGCGSSREQAPAVLKALGVAAVVAGSFARIFYRNAINIGLPVAVCADVQPALVASGATKTAEAKLDLAAGRITAAGQGFACTQLPAHMQRILDAGGLIPYLNAGGDDHAAPSAAARQTDASHPFESGSVGSDDLNKAPATAHAMTLAEKIIARAAGVPFVRPGEIHTVTLDEMMSNDGTTHITLDMYNRELRDPHLADPARMVFVIDHNSPADTPKTAAAHRKMRDFARANGITFYEGKGVCHQLMMENHVRSGEFIIGADSHTGIYGALGAFGTGVGCTDFLYGMVTGTTWVLVPESVRIVLDGALPGGVHPRDVMLSIIGDLGADGCNYQVMEFTGPGIDAMSLEDRMVLAGLAVEAGAKTALMRPDRKVVDWLAARGRQPVALFESDENAHYAAEHHYDLRGMYPVVARPDHIDDVVPARDALGVQIDEAFLGSCNGGRLPELRVAAALLKNRSVHPGVRFIVSPASNEVYRQALEEGIIQTLNSAGAMVVNANCSVCWGSCQGVMGPGEVLISTGTRNFKGRAGSPDSKVYLASAATVTASAVEGRIATEGMLV